jgi:regulator of nucleoside diphosphate kinase
MRKRITLSKSDAMRLRVLIRNERALSILDSSTLERLQDQVDRAYVVNEQALPSDVVALNSRVLIRDQQTGECSVHTIVCRSHADLSCAELSVLAPLGEALIGYRVGDEVQWSTPGGMRHLFIQAVMQADGHPHDPPPTPREPIAA